MHNKYKACKTPKLNHDRSHTKKVQVEIELLQEHVNILQVASLTLIQTLHPELLIQHSQGKREYHTLKCMHRIRNSSKHLPSSVQKDRYHNLHRHNPEMVSYYLCFRTKNQSNKINK